MSMSISPAMAMSMPMMQQIPAGMARSVPMVAPDSNWQAVGIVPGASAYPGAAMGSIGAFGYGAGAPSGYSQVMLAQALGQGVAGAQLPLQQGNDGPSPIKTIIKHAAIGGAAGFAFGLIPFLPLGPVTGAIAGTIVGGLIGVLRARSNTSAPADHTAEQMTAAQVQAQMNAQTPPGAVNAAPSTGVSTPVTPKRHPAPAAKRARRRARIRADRGVGHAQHTSHSQRRRSHAARTGAPRS